MPFSSYSDLQNSVARWLKRSNLTDLIPDFIALAEVKLNTRLRVKQMRSYSIITPSSPFVSLPGDYASMIRVQYGEQKLDYVTEDLATVQMTKGGMFNRYTIAGGRLWLQTYVDGQSKLSMHYYQKLEPLSDTNTSNWLLEDAPNIYLYAALLEAEANIKNDERLAVWNQALEQAIANLESDDDGSQHSGSVLSMKTA